MNKKLNISSFLVIIVIFSLGLFGLILSKNIPSNMDSKLFMGAKEVQALEQFHQDFGEDKQLLIMVNTPNQEEKILSLLNSLDLNFDEEPLILTPYGQNKNISSVLISFSNEAFEKLQNKLDILNTQFNKHFHEWSAAGHVWTNFYLTKENMTIQEKVFPVIFITMAIFLFLFLKNISLSVILFLISLTCTGFSFLIIKICKNEVHLLTNILPLMNFVIPLAISFHLIYGFNHYHSWEKTWKSKKKPLLLTSLTTIAGVASLYSSTIAVIQDFALLGSLTLAFNFLLTLILMYLLRNLLLDLLKKKNLPKFALLNKQNTRFNIYFFIITIIMTISGFLYLKKIPVLVEAESFFPSQHPIHQGLEMASNTLGGIPVHEWIIEKNTTITYQDLKNLDRWLDLPMETISPMGLIKKANEVYTQSYSLPDFELSARTLYGKIPFQLKMKSWQEQKIKITILGKPGDTDHEKIEHQRLKIAKQLPKEFTITSGGEFQYITQSQKDLIHSLLLSFMFSFVISTGIVSFYLKSWKLILSFVLVNLAPIALTLLLFPVFKMQLNMATIMSFSISFGLIVDGTIHLLFDKKQNSAKEDWHITNPIFISNLVIIMAFMLLLFNDFLPLWQFGLSLSLILLIGLIYDLYVLDKISLKDTPSNQQSK
jgi:predicted RND superfamily exporter protein